MSQSLQASAATQPPLLRVAVKTPVVSLATARQILGAGEFSEDDVKALVEDGELPWAWNVARRLDGRNAEIRVLTLCVEHYQRVNGARPFPELGESGVLGTIIGPQYKSVPVPHSALRAPHSIEAIVFAERMSFGSDLVNGLIRDGSLRTVKGSEARPGRGGSPLLTLDSVSDFLKARRL